MRLRGVFFTAPPILNSDGTIFLNRDDVTDRPEIRQAVDQHSKFTHHTTSFAIRPPTGEDEAVFHGYAMGKGEMFSMKAALLRAGFVEDQSLHGHIYPTGI